MTHIDNISPESVRESLSAALRKRVGTGRKPVAELAAECDIGISTIKGYLAGRAEPGLSQFLRLAAVLGPAFASEVTRQAGVEIVPTNPGTVSTVDVARKAAVLLARATEGMTAQDGRITPRVDHYVRPAIEDIVTTGRSWLAARFSRRREPVKRGWFA